MTGAPITLVTGATGFVGSAVARALIERGDRVRVLVRRGADDRNLQGMNVERAEGDLADPEAVARATAGCARVFHVAAHYSLWSRDARAMYRSNVEGTRTVLEAALHAGIERVVYTSSVGVLGIPAGDVGTVDTPVSLADMVGAYKRSKFLAEEEARRMAERGLPLVTVYPSTPIGAHDLKPTPTGKVVVDFLAGRIPAYLDTGLNYVSVEDVAAGHLLAMERAEAGGRYILGNRNMRFAEFLALLAEVAGRKAPRQRIPYAVALAASLVSEGVSRITGQPPTAPFAGVRMARKRMWFDCSRAVADLGMPQTPIEIALEQAVRWFRDNGYVS